MAEQRLFPAYFSSKAPLPEKTTLIRVNDGNTNNHLYWKLSLETDFNGKSSNFRNNQSLAPYEDNEADLIDCCDLEDNYDINPTKSGKYLTSFYVPSGLQSVIIGPKGLKLKELQENTQSLIKVPKPNETGSVKITGPSERSVASARTQITLLVLAKREKMKITHFISVPIWSSEIATGFNNFKDGVLKGPATRGIDASIFQKAEKLHLTIATLTLLDEQEIEEVKMILNKSKDVFKGIFGNTNTKPKIVLKGVEIMNDDPSEVDVLYGKVEVGSSEDNIKFQILVDEISSSFYKSGLVRKQYDNVKLHVTLMNSLFRKNEDHFDKDSTLNRRESFDASYILDSYKDFYFGSTNFNQVHLSIRFTTSKNGYYEHVLIVNL